MDHRFYMRDLVPALALIILLLSGIAIAVLAPKGKDDQYVVMVPPWRNLTSVLHSIKAADGAIVSINATSSLITVYSEHKDFPSRLYRAGTWLVFEPMQPEGCLALPQRTTAI